jgi:hypothetical protein
MDRNPATQGTDMVVVVRRSPDGKVAAITVEPETGPEEANLTNFVEQRVNLVKGLVLLNKEERIADKGVESIEFSQEAYRHK